MKTALIYFLVTTAHFVSAGPVDTEDRVKQRFIKFPDSQGNLHDIDLQAPVDQKLIDEVNRNSANNLYLLYTRRNPVNPQILVLYNATSITNSNFNPRVPTVVIVHGWLGNQNSDINPVVRHACLNRDDVNVIFVDWRRLASSNYITATNGVPAVGRALGQFLAFVNLINGVPFSQMHLVGFCLGAHIVGYAGRELEGRIVRITGLNPAGPLWNQNSGRLNPNDAIYVEAIHTNGGNIGSLGIGSDVADADFYVNDGSNQPGCITNICSHDRSWRYFADTVIRNIVGYECPNPCLHPWDRCIRAQLNMGNNDLGKRGSGRFCVSNIRKYSY